MRASDAPSLSFLRVGFLAGALDGGVVLGLLGVEGGLDERKSTGILLVEAVGEGDAHLLAELEEELGLGDAGDLAASRSAALDESALELARVLVAAHGAGLLHARVANLPALLRQPTFLALSLLARVRLRAKAAFRETTRLERLLRYHIPGRLVHGAIHPLPRGLVHHAPERLATHYHRLILGRGSATGTASATGRHRAPRSVQEEAPQITREECVRDERAELT